MKCRDGGRLCPASLILEMVRDARGLFFILFCFLVGTFTLKYPLTYNFWTIWRVERGSTAVGVSRWGDKNSPESSAPEMHQKPWHEVLLTTFERFDVSSRGHLQQVSLVEAKTSFNKFDCLLTTFGRHDLLRQVHRQWTSLFKTKNTHKKDWLFSTTSEWFDLLKRRPRYRFNSWFQFYNLLLRGRRASIHRPLILIILP